MITLHDLNKSAVRAEVREAGIVRFINPHTGCSHVVATARHSAVGVQEVSISVETESFEQELATAALLAIRGHVDDPDADALRALAKAILDYWSRGLPAPWTEMLRY